MARDAGWMAEHMLILKLTSPEGETRYVTGAFPSACGKTNLAMLIPSIEGWKVETVGDDICWMKFGADGRLYAINPEAGFFGVAPGTNTHTNPNAMLTLDGNCIFTNTALTDDGDIWWEGMTEEPPAHLTDWKGKDWTPESARPPPTPTPASRRRPARTRPSPPSGRTPGACRSRPSSSAAPGLGRPARLPVPRLGARRLPRLDHGLGDHGRRGRRRRQPAARPLRHAAVLRLQHGRLLRALAGASARSADPDNLPKIFYVNWFRKDADGKLLWPGYGENSRVLEWVFDRVTDKGEAVETPIGAVPTPGAIDIDGPRRVRRGMAELLRVDTEGWRAEVPAH